MANFSSAFIANIWIQQDGAMSKLHSMVRALFLKIDIIGFADRPQQMSVPKEWADIFHYNVPDSEYVDSFFVL